MSMEAAAAATGGTSLLGVLVALACVLLAAALLKLLLGGPRGNCVLLVGPCDAGKTTLFHQLAEGSTHQGTVASMQANVAEGPLAAEKAAAPGARPVQLVDIPGHPRVRGQMERHVGRAAGVVFVIDSVDFMPRKTEAAEQLVEVLCQPALARRRTPVLLACNKQDMGTKAHTVDFIRKRLEKEIDQLRGTRDTLSNAGGSSDQALQLGLPGEPFTFESHAKATGMRVTAATLSAIDKGGCGEVAAFIRRCVPA